MWLLVLLVSICNCFLLEAPLFHGYSLVTRWLLVGYSLVTRCLLVGYLLIELFMRYPIKKDTDLGKNTDVIV